MYLELPFYLHLLNIYQLREVIGESLPVIPVGSIEQHCNAPLGLDAMIAEALTARACLIAEGKGVKCIILPTVYYGFSPEWGSGGTLTLSLESFSSLLKDLIISLSRLGARKIAIINGHGGNSGLLEATAREASLLSKVVIGLFDYWRIAGVKIGHCYRQEEELMRNLLGLSYSCNCRKEIEIKPYKVAMANPPGIGVKGESIKPINEIIRSLAEALVDFYYAELEAGI